jgi:hypothetical protein
MNRTATNKTILETDTNEGNTNGECSVHKSARLTLPQGDFLTVNFKCLVGMRTGPLIGSDCFLPAAIKDADAAKM